MSVVGKVVIVTLNETKNAKNLIREVSWVFARQQKNAKSPIWFKLRCLFKKFLSQMHNDHDEKFYF